MNDAGILDGKRHRCAVVATSSNEFLQPATATIGLAGDMGQDGSRAVNQERAKVGSPRLLMPFRRDLPPEQYCLGTKPSQAEKWRPFLNCLASPTAATIAVAVIGPIL